MDEYDFLIIGSGFGGSVSACRLSQKGYSVAILEKGREYSDSDFPKTNWDIRKFLWAPLLKCFGIQGIKILKNLMVLHGVGVGGGSLVYANTLLRPKDDVLSNLPWPNPTSFASSLGPHYDMAEKMLGVIENPYIEDNDRILKEVATNLNCQSTFKPARVGVLCSDHLGEQMEDPYFAGDGPSRTSCTKCGGCMIGCRVGAKNTLVKNYLYFARKWGCRVFAQTKVTRIIKVDDSYKIETSRPGSYIFKRRRSFKAKNIILSAGVMGTMDLLLKNKEVYRTLPDISHTLGFNIRTNGESLVGASSFNSKYDLSKGLAIGAQINPDEFTKIEGVRYPRGSDFMKLLTTPLTPEGGRILRPILMILSLFRNSFRFIKAQFSRDWASRSIILLVMQSIDSKMNFKLGRSPFSFFTKSIQGEFDGEPLKSSIPIAQKSAEIASDKLDGIALNCSVEAGLGSITTAHILGGAIMGESAKDSVINSHNQVHGYKGLYVCDASIIPGNLAVNPSLTIAALAERFTSKFPVKDGMEEKTINFTH
ncbi:hypothetical protein BIY24_09050 [Halobacteriovorax marinus]|uniref:GMC family oxidoreductase n=1 Tax=Halobacteriovorax marinus TaxID=97084 RepID=UPI000BC350F1|nr:GMC family oxidoreductase [Halobacteriovorax marinus]ATH08091.1 hypothetical protein BIY24_09050 [Halobacteriovorax marinus]